MPLRIYAPQKGSPNFRIRGTVRGFRIDQSAGTSDRSKAEEVRARLETEYLDLSIHGAPAVKKRGPGDMTYAEAVVHYASEPGRSRRAIADQDKVLAHFGDMKCGDIDQAAIDDYIRQRHPGQSPANVIRSVITPVSAVLNFIGLRTAFRRPTVKPTRLDYLTQDQAAALVKEAADHLKPIIIFCLNTGCRIGEALALDWRAVDTRKRRVIFGGQAGTKNGDWRGVPINDSAMEALMMTKHRSGRVFRAPDGDPYAEKLDSGGQIKTAWIGACKRAGFAEEVPTKDKKAKRWKPTITPHIMRHSFASWLVMAGVPLRTVAELLGHKSLNMVMRYAHLSPDHLSNAVAAIDIKLPHEKPASERKTG